MHFLRRRQRGFTLLEVLLVIAIIAILAAIVIIAINPAKQLADTRDAQRQSDVNTILNAIYQYSIDNDGDLPGPDTITGAAQDICTDGSPCGAVGQIDISDVLTGDIYIVDFPVDPQETDPDITGYTIQTAGAGRITVSAPGAENAVISVTR